MNIKKNAGPQGRISSTVAELDPNTGNPLLDPPPPSSLFTYNSSKSKENFTIKANEFALNVLDPDCYYC